ncbi:MAG: hypothetical protein LQ349_001691 [Xanthoria aureola]|nr:MAG: hypothetical protein LQ349_001691 [Xanthoria aureola]
MLTEMAVVQLQADVDLKTPTSSGSEVVRNFLLQTLKAPGARFAYYGQSFEQPTTAFIVVGWESAVHHTKHTASPDHDVHTSLLSAVLQPDGNMTVLRVPFEQPSDDPSPALGKIENVGVTELVLYHFPSPLATKASIMDSLDKIRPVIGRSEALSVYDGWAMDEKADDKGARCSIYVNAVGWVDVDAHMRFQASDDFKHNVHHIMDVQEIRQLEMHHVKFHSV